MRCATVTTTSQRSGRRSVVRVPLLVKPVAGSDCGDGLNLETLIHESAAKIRSDFSALDRSC
jgi:hypothetical protein